MNEDQLRKIAGKENIPLGTLEKDYALTIILSKLSRKGFSKELTFKGGTAIKKAYFHNTRFSEDLDFTCETEESPNKLEKFLREEIENKQIECIQFRKITKIEKGQKSVKITLAYSDIAGHKQSLNFDLSLREKVALPQEETELLEEYDQPATKTYTMNLTEMLAEKIRALLTRGLPRDLYDIWFLLKRHVEISLPLVEQKLAFYEEKLETEKVKKRIKEIESTWKRDLEMLIRPVPEYNKVASETIEFFEKSQWFELIPKIEIKEVDTEHVEKDDSFETAQAFFVILSKEPDYKWRKIFMQEYESDPLYLMKRKLSIDGNKVRVVFGNVSELEGHIQFVGRIINQTNQRTEEENKRMIQQQKIQQRKKLGELLEAERAKKKLRKMNTQ